MLVTMFASMSVVKAETTASGDGWSFDADTGTLTITKDIDIRSLKGSVVAANPWKDSLTATVKKVVFGEGVTYVYQYLFSTDHSSKKNELSEYEQAIEEVVFPSTIESVQNDAFNGQTSLKAIEWPETSTTKVSILARAFKNISSEYKIELPANLKSIGGDAFLLSSASSPTGQYEVVIPASCETYADSTSPFASRTHIKRITFEDGCNAVLGFGALTNLNEVEMRIPGTVTVSESKGREDKWLCRNSSVPSVIYTTDASAVKTAVSSETTGKNVTFKTLEECMPYRVTIVGNAASSDSYDGAVVEVAYDRDTKTMHIYNAASGDGRIPATHRTKSGDFEQYVDEAEHMVIHEGITEVGGYVFGRKTGNVTIDGAHKYTANTRFAKVKSLSLPSTLTTISGCAFDSWSSLESLTIPASVTKIYDHAFRAEYAENRTTETLKNIYIEGAPENVAEFSKVFSGRKFNLHYGAYAESTFAAKFTNGKYEGGAWNNGSKTLATEYKHDVDATLAVSGTNATATYKNWTANAVSGKFIVAAYDSNDRFIKAVVSATPITVAAGSTTAGPKSATATATVETGAAYYKAFVWDDLTTMVPQTKVASTN